MFLFYLSIIHLSLSQDSHFPYMYSDCTHLILPSRCQCYHSGNESQLHCYNIQLDFIPKLPNNMRWHTLDFSLNHIKTIPSYVFSDIYVEKIDLHTNHLQTIDETAFGEIQNLKQLFMNHNQLKEFNPNILTSPGVTLEILDLSYNPFEYLDIGGIFYELPVLKEFYAKSCQLNNSSLSSLIKLSNYSHQYIKIIDLSYNNLTSLCNNSFNSFSSLMELRLNNNKIFYIDHYFIHSLHYLRTLNLAFNSIEYVPHLFSPSLENLNLSSNNIRHLNDYFASNLHSIRTIDFDSNKYLKTISLRSFCFINILTLEKLSFRHNDILSLNTFSELLCRLLQYTNNSQNVLDVNYNVNLECNCMLTQFEKFLRDYSDLTCTQEGQDRYFISKVKKSFSNCTLEFCLLSNKENLCQWNDTQQVISEGTCQAIIMEDKTSTIKTTIESKVIKTTVKPNLWKNLTQNFTGFFEGRTFNGVSMKKIDYTSMCLLLFLLYI
ncbi:unnamed protein product [Adineta steineri]|uniref:Uncharacterized protein n=1 Tax=Adineta steineri TaxID=433720 RepID=A0A819DZK2_9BILA|nr:unnamed protein product [Adineta steineri]CAF3841664.1 unnamed protein product [Adineta steineri]